jgi:hypothetical protein
MRPLCTYFGGIPSPYLANVLLGAGLTKSVCKILMSKTLEVKIFKILRTKSLGRDKSRIARCLGLDHDRARLVDGARSDVTVGCGNIQEPKIFSQGRSLVEG